VITPVAIPADVRGYAQLLVDVLRDVYADDLVGVYLHGSAVLGGFGHDYSDVDVLVVVGSPGSAEIQHKVGDALAATVEHCPGTSLELSVLTSATAARLGDCPFEVHVNASRRAAVVIPGHDHAGDLDLVLHSAVCRAHGLAVSGPVPPKVFAAVPKARLTQAIANELTWSLANAPTAYAVLNACRALRFARDGELMGKVSAAQWYLSEHPGTEVVTAALAQQRRGEKVRPIPPAAQDFVRAAGRRLASA
jgi:streptomycin 3"-adenylyltransferase